MRAPATCAILLLALGATNQQPTVPGVPAVPAVPAVPVPGVDYSMSASLDVPAKQVSGRERIVWRNPSRDVVPDLWFHLYLNAFKNARTTFNRESGGQLRGLSNTGMRPGRIDVTSLRLSDGTDLRPAL